MAILCQKLRVPFDPDFEQNWSEYDKITGDTSKGKLKAKEIKEPVRKEVPEDLLQDFSRNKHYQESLEILGYEHPQGVTKSDKRLPRIVTTSVIRSAYQGQSHGGVYIVDLQEETSEQVVDWNTVDIDWGGRGLDRGLRGIAFYKQEIFIAASDELFVMGEGWQIARSYRNPYLKHCHEICLHQDRIYLTSTGFDSVLEFDPDREMFTKGYHLRQKPDEQELTQWTFDPNQDDGPQAGDSVHINNVCSHDGQLFMSALRLPYLFKLEGSSFVKQLDIPTGTHNARPYKDGVLFNNTNKSTVCYMDSSGNIVQEWNIPIYSESKLENAHLPKDHARQGFGRGLCPLDEDIVIAGSSPATISVYSSKDNALIKTINLSRDIRNAIHGLEILSRIPASQLQEEPRKLYISAELPKRETEEPNAYVRNFNELASCRDESYSEIYIDHILLQLSQHELPAVLKGLHRILTPQGKLKISIPDLDVLCRHFLDPDLTANQRLQVMNMMYCGQDQTDALQRMGLNFDLLRSYLLQAEFEKVEKSADCLMPKEASTFSLDGESVYLNVTAYKQAPSKADSTSEGNIRVDTQSDQAPKVYKGPEIKVGEKPNISWIVSYPKSGNTWIRFLVGNMVFGDMQGSQELDKHIPGIHKFKSLSVENKDRAFLKTHWMWGENMPGAKHTASAIYIVRNPFDVLASNFNYLGADTPEKKQRLFEDFIRNNGLSQWINLSFGSWNSNIESWLFQDHPFPVFFVRYEDLLEDCFSHMLELRNFLSIDVPDEEVEKAVERSSFNRVKDIEKKELEQERPGFFLQGYKAKKGTNYRFMNKGTANTFFDVLTEEQIHKLHETFEPMMKRLGYRLDMESKQVILEEPEITQHEAST